MQNERLWGEKAIFRAHTSAEKVTWGLRGGGGGIRTPETLSGLTVFKTAGLNRSPTPPVLIILALVYFTTNCVAHLLHTLQIIRMQKGQIFRRHGAWHLRYRSNGKQISFKLTDYSDQYRTLT